MVQTSLLQAEKRYRQVLSQLTIHQLDISEYNKNYLHQLLSSLPYFTKIYSACLQVALRGKEEDLSSWVVVDYGGGSGLLSIFLKLLGVGTVIYVDTNRDSVHTVQQLKKELQAGPDIIIQGDSADLLAWCTQHQLSPSLLLSTDVIEHVYCLPSFFAQLYQINPHIHWVFTTGSTPYNPLVTYRLKKLMKNCEQGDEVTPNFYEQRKQIIALYRPQFNAKELANWALATRGLHAKDIGKSIDRGVLPIPPDSFNTCDPSNGNCTERILSGKAYQNLVKPYGYGLSISSGFYNVQQASSLKSFVAGFLNRLLAVSGKAGLVLAPFIILSFKKTS